VCGNNKCEPPYETCTNCPGDCGSCTTPTTCIEAVMCAFNCVDTSATPPSFSFACISNCSAQACANAQFAVDQVLTCAEQALFTDCLTGGGGGVLACVQKKCSAEINVCIGTQCK
jgi:hypothetical protein